MKTRSPFVSRLCALAVSLSVSAGLAGCFPPLPDAPTFGDAEAFCDTEDNWNLYAVVNHQNGPEAVQAVYVEVGLAFYDESDEVYTEGQIGEAVDLLRITDSTNEWSTQLASEAGFLDCAYDFEYYLLFIAEDEEGDQAGRSIIN